MSQYFVQVELDDYPQPGYRTAVQVYEMNDGWVITDLMVSLARTPLEERSNPFDLSIGIRRTGLNEAGVSARALSQVNESRIKQAVWESIQADPPAEGLPDTWEEAIEPMRAWAKTTGEGRTNRDDLFYARLARSYEGAARDPDSRNKVHEALAEALNKSPATVQDYVKEARKRGFLTSGGRGKVGGKITEEARTLLQEAGDL